MSEAAAVEFVPGRMIRYDRERLTLVKGRAGASPRKVHFAEVYGQVPVLPLGEVLQQVDGLRSHGVAGWRSAELTRCPGDLRAGSGPVGPEDPDRPASLAWVARLTRPFRICDGTDEKIADSLGWMHSRLSTAAQQVGRPATDLFRAYALLLKADGYFLARHVTPNVSMGLQRRLIAALAPGALRQDQERTRRANARALRVLARLDPGDDVLQACLLSVFAGTTWFAEQDAAADLDPQVLGGGLGAVLAGTQRWGVDARDAFVAAALAARRMVAVLDDSGEVVFDLALLQALLAANPELVLTVLAHRDPDGVNATAAEVQLLLGARPFAGLSGHAVSGRFRVVAVDQDLPSFEPELFPLAVRRLLQVADVVLVKGAGYYETTVLDRPAFYAFVVHSLSSRLVTGQPAGSGIFLAGQGADASALLPAGSH